MEKSAFFEEYCRVFEKNGLKEYTDPRTVEQMYRMVAHMLEVNSYMNLTAITDPKEVIVKHLADSCTVLSYIPEGTRVCDVGCGGGFPSLPMAIARPDVQVVGIDSTGKKVNYINETALLLGLDNLTAICGRAEELAMSELRESFDVVTARAVAALPMLCELCIPFVRVGGLFCAMKGAPDQSEVALARSAFQKLGAPLEDCDAHSFLLEGDGRVIFAVEKRSATPKSYPRAFAQIKKKPL